jgi:LDH2 family malate/lactate/ureidoglycolate dehydrogenase
MAPWGGKARLLGNNPLSVAVPAGNYPPLVLDMATGASAWGKIFLALQQGKKIPLTWALDKNGQPTDDPNVAFAGGSIQPIGEYKGYGLSLMLDVLAGVLTGGAFSNYVPAWNEKEKPQQCGHFMAAFRIDCFLPVDVFRQRIDELICVMKDCPPAPGRNRVMVPGEIEYETEQQRRAQGIPIHSAVKQDLVKLGQELSVTPPF